MSRRPWLFESSLLSLKPFDGHTPALRMDFYRESFWVQLHNLSIAYMNEDMGNLIGNTIGLVKECDIQNDGSRWDTIWRVLIELDLHKPISKGRTLNVQGIKTWVPLTYKKLSRIYFRCGRIIHKEGLYDGMKNLHNNN